MNLFAVSFLHGARLRAILVCLFIACWVSIAHADGFSALVSPPRVETGVKSGQTTRQVLEVTQVGPQLGKFRVYTTDWQLNDRGGVDFFEALQPGSCRPWVALERRELSVPGNGKGRFRFEITPPGDATQRECRFAIMFEGMDSSAALSGDNRISVTGRIGVIVYAVMEGAQPVLKVIGQALSSDVSRLPELRIQNTGDAHGRVEGLLAGVDSSGARLEFTPSSLPILPGETRTIRLTANVEGGPPVSKINYPVTIKGALELAGRRQSFEHTFQEK